MGRSAFGRINPHCRFVLTTNLRQDGLRAAYRRTGATEEQWQATALGRGGDWAEAFLDRCTLVDMYANHEGSIPVANRARSVVAELAAEACGQECGCWAELLRRGHEWRGRSRIGLSC